MKTIKTTSLIAAVILLFSCTSKTTTNDCERFKNGKFNIHFRSKQGDMFFNINRKDTIQTEIETNTGYTSTLHVHWTDKCSYEILLLETTFPFPDSVQKIRKTIPLKTEIISTGSNYYVFKAHRDNQYSITDTMWVAK